MNPLRSSSPALALRAAILLAGLSALLMARPAFAGEGASSHYMPGTMGDFAMALIGPPGFYVRNDVMFFEGDIQQPLTLGGRVYASASQDVWANTVKLIHLSKGGVLGGRFGAVVSVPIVIGAEVSGEMVTPFSTGMSGSRSGFSDISLTGFLNWSAGMHHTSAGFSVFAPTGDYEEGRIINLGRNYWSFDPIVTYTWLHPERGHEVSATTGVMFNTANDATEYTSGVEWHIDFMLAQHLSKKLAVGAEGSVLQGITDDDGPLLDFANAALAALGMQSREGFRARYFGLGPAVLVSTKIEGTDVNFIAKYLFDITHENRFNSDYLVVSAAFKFL